MKRTVGLALTCLAVSAAALTLYGLARQQPQAAIRLIVGAADALAGRDRVLAVRTIVLDGYGEAAYQNGGGNISASPDALQKWVSIPELRSSLSMSR